MKRRTNLFYSSGNDAKFLTFSNYTECITGTFLSTNTKLFPSTFICLNIPGISTDSSKEAFIKRLVAYYENKLAFLRDESNNDEQLQPLAYLLRFLKSEGITNIPYITYHLFILFRIFSVFHAINFDTSGIRFSLMSNHF